jgi:peptidoglycan/LPS O-acetylase OafA/YrhL
MPSSYSYRDSRSKIEALESLRGLAALLVVLYHLPKWNPILDTPIINNGYLMVELFFVLSGFVIYKAYDTHLHNVTELVHFQFLRFARLYPVHLLFLLAFVGIELSKYIAQRYFNLVSPNTQPLGEDYIVAFIEQLFLVQAIGPTGNATTFNGPAWSISVEFYTYLLFGITTVLAKKHKVIWFALFAALSLAAILTNAAGGFSDLLRCFIGFFIGCLTAYVLQKPGLHIAGIFAWMTSAALIVFLQYKTMHQADAFIYPITAMMIGALFLSPKGSLSRLFQHPWLTYLGTLSYAVYMSHWAMIWVVNQVLRVILKMPEALINGTSVPQLSSTQALVTSTITVISVIIVSILVYRYVEAPIRLKSRQIISKAENRF